MAAVGASATGGSGMIELRTLGAVDLKGADGRAVRSILAQPKRLALLAYLAVHTAGARRDSVVALFWPELDGARPWGPAAIAALSPPRAR